jgi:hypothetical protein
MIRFIIIGMMAIMLSACVAPWGPMHGGGMRAPHMQQDSGYHNVSKIKNTQPRPY